MITGTASLDGASSVPLRSMQSDMHPSLRVPDEVRMTPGKGTPAQEAPSQSGDICRHAAKIYIDRGDCMLPEPSRRSFSPLIHSPSLSSLKRQALADELGACAALARSHCPTQVPHGQLNRQAGRQGGRWALIVFVRRIIFAPTQLPRLVPAAAQASAYRA